MAKRKIEKCTEPRPEIEPEVLAHMKRVAIDGDVWHVYQNCALDHSDLGRTTFLVVGETRTFKTHLPHAPDSAAIGFGYRYLHVGTVDLVNGTVVPWPEYPTRYIKQ